MNRRAIWLILYNVRATFAASGEKSLYTICEQQMFKRVCASSQSRQKLYCSLTLAVDQEETSVK